MNKLYYVYIMTNKYNRLFYTGVTDNLKRRVYEHKLKVIEGFTKKYNCDKLIWYDISENITSAIIKEKQIKRWKRAFKENVINEFNPEWQDLYEFIV